jgi:hypothetical protein
MNLWRRRGWIVRRLLAMGPAEILSRLIFAVKKRLWSRGRFLTPRAGILCGLRPADLEPAPPPSGAKMFQALLDEAEQMLAGHFRVLGLRVTEDPFDWHLEPQSGLRAPRQFGPSLQYRDPALVGEARNIWEKGRQHSAARLAAAYWVTHDQRFSAKAAQLIESFVRDNPFPVGIQWATSLEAAIRLINWVWIERLLRESPEHDSVFGPEGSIWPSVRAHQHFVINHLSAGSSANNHLIGEAAGLFISACAWGRSRYDNRLRKTGARLLEREIGRQFFPSGLNREMAFDYHGFALEFLTLAFEEGRRSQHPFSHAFQETLGRAISAGLAWFDGSGSAPRYGDSDKGRVFSADASEMDALQWLAKYGREVLGLQLPSWPGEQASVTAAALGLQGGAATEPAPVVSHCDSDAGLYALVSGDSPGQEVYCLVDAGPLGYLSIAAHGHADALSFCLSVAGRPVVVDAGTYCYHGDLERRGYFRGTAAHNTVCVDGADQSQQAGAFLWTQKATTQVIRWSPTPEGGEVCAEHDGYGRIDKGTIHRRTVELRSRSLHVSDQLTGPGAHRIEWRVHFHPAVTVTLDGARATLSWATGSGRVDLDSRLVWKLDKAGTSAGWYSSDFNSLEPTVTLVGELQGDLPVDVLCQFHLCPGELDCD